MSKRQPWQGSQWVVQEGLRAGDRVVVDGLQRIGSRNAREADSGYRS